MASAALNYSAEILDQTAMGDDTRVRKGGLFDWTVDINFHQDFSAGDVDATLFTLVGTTTCFELRVANTCTTTINPSYTGIAVLKTYNPISGNVGTLLDAPANFVSAGTLSRSVAAT